MDATSIPECHLKEMQRNLQYRKFIVETIFPIICEHKTLVHFCQYTCPEFCKEVSISKVATLIKTQKNAHLRIVTDGPIDSMWVNEWLKVHIDTGRTLRFNRHGASVEIDGNVRKWTVGGIGAEEKGHNYTHIILLNPSRE